jgi:predicted metalloprotease
MRLGRLRRRRGGTIDRRGQGGFGGLGFPSTGGGVGLPIPGGGGVGIGLLVVALLIFGAWQVLDDGSILGSGSGGETQLDTRSEGDSLANLVDAVGDDVQLTWRDIFEREGTSYRFAEIVLDEGQYPTPCGTGSASVGPFYCPADEHVYLDLSFFKELERRFGAPGDFAIAYVIAHEFGHHVQNLLGTNARVERGSRANPAQSNELSVRLELQADCLAGVWARDANGRDVLQPGDLEEGMTAAAAVGDDRIQGSTRGRINPEAWTHGSSEQRTTWLRTGFQVGNPDACDTFSPRYDEL